MDRKNREITKKSTLNDFNTLVRISQWWDKIKFDKWTQKKEGRNPPFFKDIIKMLTSPIFSRQGMDIVSRFNIYQISISVVFMLSLYFVFFVIDFDCVDHFVASLSFDIVNITSVVTHVKRFFDGIRNNCLCNMYANNGVARNMPVGNARHIVIYNYRCGITVESCMKLLLNCCGITVELGVGEKGGTRAHEICGWQCVLSP